MTFTRGTNHTNHSIVSSPWSKKFLLVLLVSSLIQIWIAVRPDTMGDVLVYRDWCRVLTQDGIIDAYSSDPVLKSRGTEIDYPPVYPYILMLLGKCLNYLAPELFATSDRFVDSAIKLLSVFANILIVLLLYVELKGRKGVTIAVVAASAYAFNPAAIFNTAYWGQTESISTLMVLAALVLMRRGYPEWSWAMIIVAILTKPLALPFLPLIMLATMKESDSKRIVFSSAAATVAFLLIFSPFLLAGRFEAILKTLLFQIDAMPYLSVNAHNFWWIIQRGRPWIVAANDSWKFIATVAFGIFYIVTLYRYWRTRQDSSLYIAAASIAFGFFMLSTHMHENHLFQFLPLLSLFSFDTDRLRKIYLIVTLTFFINMVLHDPFINHVFAPYSFGPTLDTWSGNPPHYPIYETFKSEGKGYVVEETTGEISGVRLLLTLLNSQVNCLLFFYWLMAFYFRTKSFDEQYHPVPVFTRSRLLFMMIFLVVTAVPFLLKVGVLFKSFPKFP